MVSASTNFAVVVTALNGLFSLVAAHGFVQTVSVNGKDFPGPLPGRFSSDSPIRRINTVNPMTIDLISSVSMSCNIGSQPAGGSIDVKGGDTLSFSWSGLDSDNITKKPWAHKIGPLMTYVAPCNGPCSQFSDTTFPGFFKIDEKGFKGDPSAGVWVQSDLATGTPVDVTLPQGLPNGQYLVRHEVIVLEGETAEFFPSCTQISVTGTSSDFLFPEVSQSVVFPGAYKASDPGLQTNFSTPYEFPGGAMPEFGRNATTTSITRPSTVAISASSSGTVPTLSVFPTGSSSLTTTPTASVSSGLSAPTVSGTPLGSGLITPTGTASVTGTFGTGTPITTLSPATTPLSRTGSITGTTSAIATTITPSAVTDDAGYDIVIETVIITVQPEATSSEAPRVTRTQTKVVTVTATAGSTAETAGYKRAYHRRAIKDRMEMMD